MTARSTTCRACGLRSVVRGEIAGGGASTDKLILDEVLGRYNRAVELGKFPVWGEI